MLTATVTLTCKFDRHHRVTLGFLKWGGKKHIKIWTDLIGTLTLTNKSMTCKSTIW
ncbi:hypothetical protein Hdeb2414_s0002g00045851 [Helianthus debilis subsp. tardiflorus]